MIDVFTASASTGLSELFEFELSFRLFIYLPPRLPTFNIFANILFLCVFQVLNFDVRKKRSTFVFPLTFPPHLLFQQNAGLTLSDL